MPRRRYSAAELAAMIPLYFEGALNDAERAAVEAWWADHPEALKQFAESARWTEILDAAVTAPPVDDRFTADVMAHLAALTPRRRWWLGRPAYPPLTLLRWLAEAALLVFLIGLLWLHPWAPPLTRAECRLLGDPVWEIGRPTGLRVLLRDRATGQPLVQSEVRLRLIGQPWRWTIHRGLTNDQGTLDLDLNLPPSVAPGAYWLVAEADTKVGRTRVWERLELRASATVTLYLPVRRAPVGQRLVALAQVARVGGVAGESLAWRLDDASGVALASGREELPESGQLWLRIPLSAELAPGAVRLTATAAGARASVEATATGALVTELPLELRLARPDLLRGERLQGELTVSPGLLDPWAATTQVELTVRAGAARRVTRQRTDPAGRLAFDLPLPPGATQQVVLTVRAYDALARQGGAEVAVPLGGPEILAARPAGALVAGGPNWLRLSALRPAGAAACGRMAVSCNGSSYRWVALPAGRNAVYILPRPGLNRLDLLATIAGQRWQRTIWTSARPTLDGLVVQVDREQVAPGTPVVLHLTAFGERGPAFVDLLQQGRTVATRSLYLGARPTPLVVQPPDGLAGPVAVRAYARLRGRWRTGWTTFHRQPADDLRIRCQARSDELLVTAHGEQDEPRAATLPLAGLEVPAAPPVAAAPPRPVGFGLRADSQLLARRAALQRQRWFFEHSPLFGGIAGGLVLLITLLWLGQGYRDPFEVVTRAERRRWGRLPQVRSRHAWRPIGILAVALLTALVVAGGLALAGWQARELATAATAVDESWYPRPAPWPTAAARAVEGLLSPGAAPAGPLWAGAVEPLVVTTAAADGQGRTLRPPTGRQVVVFGAAGRPLAQTALPRPPGVSLDLSLPPRLTVGDELTVRVTLVHPGEQPLAVTVQATAEGGLTISGGATQRLVLAPRAVRRLALPVRATAVGRASLRLVARGGAWQADRRAPCEVHPAGWLLAGQRTGPPGRWTVKLPAATTALALQIRPTAEPWTGWEEALRRSLEQPVGSGSGAVGRLEASAALLRLWQLSGRLNAVTRPALARDLSLARQGLRAYEPQPGCVAGRPAQPPSATLTARALVTLAALADGGWVDPRAVAHGRQWLRQQPAPRLSRPLAPAVLEAAIWRAWALEETSPEAWQPLLDAAPDPARSALLIVALADRQVLPAARAALLERLRATVGARAPDALWFAGGGLGARGSQGRGTVIAAQAEALLALQTGGRPAAAALRAGAGPLAAAQVADGTWGSAALTARAVLALAAAGPAAGPARGTLVAALDGREVARWRLPLTDPGLVSLTPAGGERSLTTRFSGRGTPGLGLRWSAGTTQRPPDRGLRLAGTLDRTTARTGQVVRVLLRITNLTDRPATPWATLVVPPGCGPLPPATARDGLLTVGCGLLPAAGERVVTVSLLAADPARGRQITVLAASPDDPSASAQVRLPGLTVLGGYSNP
ncbi:MAG: hypothetical protein IT204_00455 [Fimbriimonadaceae bacterium]|nr:hypothetical protein [Fimbriimonadaceae bacterium]